MRLKGKVAIVTGASRGIGKAIAIEFGREGAAVVVAARTEKESERFPGTIYQTAEEVEKGGGRAIPVRCDVTREEEIQAMVERALKEFGQIDILVNNAGISLPYDALLWETPVRHWDLLMAVNLRGPFLCLKYALPHMVARRSGSIINISSTAATESVSRSPTKDGRLRLINIPYGVSKAALERLTVGLAVQLRDYNIAVNALKPSGPTFSEGLLYHLRDADLSYWRSPYQFMTKAALFLATQDASGVTGGIFTDEELCNQFNLT
jgi:NAD(P)-dependent dehydrogenase (short-subunit alcohol dehydrogenase family)